MNSFACDVPKGASGAKEIKGKNTQEVFMMFNLVAGLLCEYSEP